jgi:hypothetical protein
LLLEITRRILGIGSADAGADGGTERRSGTGGKESAANDIGIGLTMQRSDRHVGMLLASIIVVPSCEG